MSDSVTDLAIARSARAAEVERRAATRPFLVHVVLTSFGVMPPNADPDADPRIKIIDAADHHGNRSHFERHGDTFNIHGTDAKRGLDDAVKVSARRESQDRVRYGQG